MRIMQLFLEIRLCSQYFLAGHHPPPGLYSLTTGCDLVFFYDVILDYWSTMPKNKAT